MPSDGEYTAHCRDKYAYPSKGMAKAIISKAERLGRARRGSLSAYRCACGSWHVGHKPRDGGAAARAAMND